MNDDKLYSITMQCVKLNEAGCSHECHLCQYNVFNYVKDVREAALLKATVYTDYYNQKQIMEKANRTVEAASLAPLILIVLIVLGVAWCCSSVKSCMSPSTHSYAAPQQIVDDIVQLNMSSVIQRYTPMTINDDIIYLLNNPNKIENVPLILAVMRQQGVRDINNDGKVNCIDYSITFRHLYGSNARLIINNNPRSGMNHMFIRVYYGVNEFIDIEPQGTPQRYSMGLIWGMLYKWNYNKDVTSQWSHVVGGM